ICGICEEPVCKNCAQFLEVNAFSFEPALADELKHSYYCSACHAEYVEPALSAYEATMEQAKQTYIFFTTQKTRLPIESKAKLKLRVENCPDRDETILRLAFLAVQQGYNSVIETEVVAEKIRNAGYQKSNWQGT